MVTALVRFAVELIVPAQNGSTPLWDNLNLSTWAQLCNLGMSPRGGIGATVMRRSVQFHKGQLRTKIFPVVDHCCVQHFVVFAKFSYISSAFPDIR